MSILNSETPLEQVKRHFTTFAVEQPKKVEGAEILVSQDVAFKKECRESASETLTIQKIQHEMVDGDMMYLMLEQRVPGPITDGNRIQKVDDCEIKTIVRMEPFIEGKTNITPVKKSQKMSSVVDNNSQKMASVVGSKPQSPGISDSGCRSNGVSLILLVLVIVFLLLLKKRKRYAIEDGRATRDIAAGELIELPLEEYLKIMKRD